MGSPAVVPVCLLVDRLRRRQQCFCSSCRTRALDHRHNLSAPEWDGEPTLCRCLRWVWRHHTLHMESCCWLPRPADRPLLGCRSGHHYRHTDRSWDDHSDIQIRRFVVAGTGCSKTLDDHDHYYPAAADDYNHLAAGRCCQSALPNHYDGSNWRYSALCLVGQPSVAEWIAIQCGFAGHDQRRSSKWHGGHNDTYVHGF